jgi:[ribosomal protein S18]-alanine N-acetyltransferase
VAGITVREGQREDLPRVLEIQTACPEASRWPPQDYLDHLFLLAICENQVAGFLVARRIADGESEVLNLAVAPEFRRRGAGRRLFQDLQARYFGHIYLELRESNRGARAFYETLGFQEVGVRLRYYQDPVESAIVMKFHSC